jgi:hypothetical protein
MHQNANKNCEISTFFLTIWALYHCTIHVYADALWLSEYLSFALYEHKIMARFSPLAFCHWSLTYDFGYQVYATQNTKRLYHCLLHSTLLLCFIQSQTHLQLSIYYEMCIRDEEVPPTQLDIQIIIYVHLLIYHVFWPNHPPSGYSDIYYPHHCCAIYWPMLTTGDQVFVTLWSCNRAVITIIHNEQQQPNFLIKFHTETCFFNFSWAF